MSNCDLHLKILGQAGPETIKMKLKLDLPKLKGLLKQIREPLVAEGICLFSQLSIRIYIVRIIELKDYRVVHFIMIDASRGVILDSVEEKQINVCAESIEMYCGTLSTKKKV